MRELIQKMPAWLQACGRPELKRAVLKIICEDHGYTLHVNDLDELKVRFELAQALQTLGEANTAESTPALGYMSPCKRSPRRVQ